jgi:hypothetical protein
MRPAFAMLSLAGALASTPAHATGELSCGDGKDVSIDLLVGHVDVLSVARVVIRAGDKAWSSAPDVFPGEPIRVGQAFADDTQLLVDLTDDAVTEIVARLRLVTLAEGDSRVTVGALSVKGAGAWAVTCSEAE